MSNGFVDRIGNALKDVEHMRNVLISRILGIRPEADFRQVSEIQDVDSARYQTLYEPGLAQAPGRLLLSNSTCTGT